VNGRSHANHATRRIAGGCYATTAVLLAAVSANPAFAQSSFGEWANTEPVVGVGGGCPIESRNGLDLYTASARSGSLDIWVYERKGRDQPFGPPIRLGAPVSLPARAEGDVRDFCPTPLPGYWLMFVSNREGSCGPTSFGNSDMYIAQYKPSPQKAWGEARHLGCAPEGPNTPGTELSPSLITTSEGVYLYYSTNGPAGDQDIYRSLMALDGSFGPGEPVDALNTEYDDQQPNVGRNGLEIVFSSNRDGDGIQDVYSASRDSADESWSQVRNLTAELALPPENADQTRASLSWDLKRLYYGSGGVIYVSERTPE